MNSTRRSPVKRKLKVNGPPEQYESYFSAHCRICLYCKEGHMDFHEALMHTKHIDINEKDTVTIVWQRMKPTIAGKIIPYNSVMQHVRCHILPAHEAIRKLKTISEYHNGSKVVTEENLAELIGPSKEGASKGYHEVALDNFIREFDKLLKEQKLTITASAGLQAIKIKADIEKSNRDRKVDFVKFFAGRGQGNG